MKSKPYPSIPDIEFRCVPKSALNLTSGFQWPLDKLSDDIFHGYAITSNKEVWYGRGMPWHKVELHEDHQGNKTAALKFFGQPGQTVVPFDLLYEHIFSRNENT